MSSWTPTTYKTKSWADYNRALKQRGSLSIWFDAEMAWEAQPSGQRGRQQAYIDAAIQAYLTIKELFGLPLRQTAGFVESLLELVNWTGQCRISARCAAHYPTTHACMCERVQRSLSVAIPYRGSTGPLHLLVDSTGIKAECEGEWNACKHGGVKRRLWRKIHRDRRGNAGNTGHRGDKQQHRGRAYATGPSQSDPARPKDWQCHSGLCLRYMQMP